MSPLRNRALANSIGQMNNFCRVERAHARRQRLRASLDTVTIVALVCAAAVIFARAALNTLAALPTLTAPTGF